MPFSYTDEQDAFAETVTETLRRHCPMSTVRATIAEPARWKEIWSSLVALDLTALLIPEDLGGLELSMVELVAVLEAAGRFAAPVPLTSTLGLFTPLVLAAAATDPAAATPVLQRVLAGAAGTVALSASGPAMRGIPHLDGDRISGTCEGVAEASRAELVAVPAVRDSDDRIVLVVAEADVLGLTPMVAMDPGSPVGRLELDRRSIAGAVTLDGDLAAAWPAVWTAAAAELVGLAAEIVRISVQHASERVQFGKPIGAFEAVKHQLVDSHVANERARSLTMYAAALASQDAGPATERAAHHAKASASQAATKAARVGVQVHGGLGITQEHDISLLYLRARQLSQLLGTADQHYALAASLAG